MNNELNENWDKGEKFQEQFQKILDDLCAMPVDTDEERRQRYTWFRNLPDYDYLVLEILKALDAHTYDNLEKRMKQEYVFDQALPENLGIASTVKKTELDMVVFLEALKEAVEYYTGVNTSGKHYTFLQSVGQKYYQKKLYAAGENDIQAMGISTSVNKKRKYKVMQLVRKVRELSKSQGTSVSIREILKQCVAEDSSSRYSKEEIQLAYDLIENLDIGSTDILLPEEETTLGALIEDPDTSFVTIEMQEKMLEIFDKSREKFAENWELLVKAGAKKKDREYITVFLSRNILVALKLQYLEETLKKQYKTVLEPGCNSWCPRTTCIYAGKENEKTLRRDSCYIRYPDLYQDDPRSSLSLTGDVNLCCMLEKMGIYFYENILDNAYVKYAYTEEVQNYQDLLRKPLKPAKSKCGEECFQFTDVVIGRVLGESAANVSKYQKKYKEKVIPALYEKLKEEWD